MGTDSTTGVAGLTLGGGIGFLSRSCAVNRFDEGATAYPHRDAAYNLGISAGWEAAGSDEAAIDWTKTLHADLAAYSTGGVYMNYLDRDDGARLESAYGENWLRLQQVKAKYDPDNFC